MKQNHQDKIAFNGMIDAIVGDLKYAFSQFDLTDAEKERGKRELLSALQNFTIGEPVEDK